MRFWLDRLPCVVLLSLAAGPSVFTFCHPFLESCFDYHANGICELITLPIWPWITAWSCLFHADPAFDPRYCMFSIINLYLSTISHYPALQLISKKIK